MGTKQNPRLIYWIENPVGLMRHQPEMKAPPFRATFDQCRYGKPYMKPTDIFTNQIGLTLNKCRKESRCDNVVNGRHKQRLVTPEDRKTESISNFSETTASIPPLVLRDILSQIN